MKVEPYETRFGRVFPSRVLETVIGRIREDHDSQRVITEELRDLIPVHDEDLDEAMEVYGHCEDILADMEGGFQ
jgi:hypothetical protein